ncbi:MAG: hypothetical protein FRX48_09214 [Lasallia pustulata]|uniref:Uncharacterized protein n=1 Tax=Lasallia pustulata TaxID=136370 RepID=A0A5M8PD51_9LECA|nr:MAG: hypothetical protein FRX48_09214 [Lasallia pustulata]
MFDFGKEDGVASSCYFTHGTLPKYIDPEQPPASKKPFSTIMGQSFTHTVDVLLPEELYELICNDIESKLSSVQYSRVIMPLSALLEGDFFNSYIKSGNILMLSEGRPGVDNVFSLKDGILRLELAKESYERAGLVGKPVRDGGRKHIKTRYVVELNLRLPSMLHGKKGFERIVWAFKNVLNNSITWLFYDFEVKEDSVTCAQANTNPLGANTNPLAKHHPLVRSVARAIRRSNAVLVPPFNLSEVASDRATAKDWAIEFHEWLSLVLLGSHSVRADNRMDSYLCRYSVLSEEVATPTNLVHLRWSGFLPAPWIRTLFFEFVGACKAKPRAWLALNVRTIRTEAVQGLDGYTIFRLPGSSGENSKDNTEGASEADGEGEKGKAARPGVDYMLWELASATDGRP